MLSYVFKYLLTTNLGVGSSNLSGRANLFNDLAEKREAEIPNGVPLGFQRCMKTADSS